MLSKNFIKYISNIRKRAIISEWRSASTPLRVFRPWHAKCLLSFCALHCLPECVRHCACMKQKCGVRVAGARRRPPATTSSSPITWVATASTRGTAASSRSSKSSRTSAPSASPSARTIVSTEPAFTALITSCPRATPTRGNRSAAAPTRRLLPPAPVSPFFSLPKLLCEKIFSGLGSCCCGLGNLDWLWVNFTETGLKISISALYFLNLF